MLKQYQAIAAQGNGNIRNVLKGLTAGTLGMLAVYALLLTF